MTLFLGLGFDQKHFENPSSIYFISVSGCITEPIDFVAGGTCEEQLMGMAETLWEPKMQPDQLFECISQAMMNAFDRDGISGWGAVVHVIEKDKVTTRTLKTRMD